MNTSQTPAPQTFPMPNEAEGARIAALDVVRGIAVLGILAANIVAFGQGMTAYGWPGGFFAPPGPFADWLWGAQLVLVDGKFRGLFTLLFGAGMVLFFRRAQAKGAGHGLLARRLGWLGLFGFAHWALLWRGDILLSYAIGGLAVLAFVGWEWTRQLTLGLIGYTVGTIAVTAAAAAPMVVAALPRTAEARAGLAQAKADEIADGKVEAALSMAGDYGGMIRHTLGEHLALLPGDTLPVLFETVPLMLIGMALLGAGAFDGRLAPRRQAARAGRCGCWAWPPPCRSRPGRWRAGSAIGRASPRSSAGRWCPICQARWGCCCCCRCGGSMPAAHLPAVSPPWGSAPSPITSARRRWRWRCSRAGASDCSDGSGGSSSTA